MDKTIPQIADFVIKKLKKEGFIIQRYDSFSTNSIYLKLDYGVANSIRISDHKGKKHLQYRYNLLSKHNSVNRYKTTQGWDRFYYPFDSVEVMLQDIINSRNQRVRLYGIDRYECFMKTNQLDGKQKAGFWAHCVEV